MKLKLDLEEALQRIAELEYELEELNDPTSNNNRGRYGELRKRKQENRKSEQDTK